MEESHVIEWEYVDSSEKVQGPFAEGLMRNWFTKGFFQKTIKVRKVGETEFKTIKEYQPDFAEDLGEPEKEPEERGEEMPTPKEPEEAAEPEGEKELEWLYIDNDGEIQGPFPNETMMSWYGAGHFVDSILVKKYIDGVTIASSAEGFRPIHETKECEFVTEIERVPDKAPLKWFYKDEGNKTRGPYSSKVMLQWIRRGFMNLSVRIRTTSEKKYKPIADRDDPFGEAEHPELEKPVWIYLDTQGIERGPYTRTVIEMWYKKRVMPPAIKVRMKDEAEWRTVLEMLQTPEPKRLPPKPVQPPPQPEAPPEKGEDAKWHYIDVDNNKEQGPFSTDMMRTWHGAGYFPPTTRVRNETEAHFVAIKDRKHTAFTLPPPKPAPESQPPPPVTAAPVAPAPRVMPMMPQPGRPMMHMMMPGFGGPRMGPPRRMAPPPMMMSEGPEPDWFYIGDDGLENGPFTSKQMRGWFMRGHLALNVRVRQAGEGKHRYMAIGMRPCCFTLPRAELRAPSHNVIATRSQVKLERALDKIGANGNQNK